MIRPLRAAFVLGGASLLTAAVVAGHVDAASAGFSQVPAAASTGVVEGRVYLPDLDERDPPVASPYAQRRYRPPAGGGRGGGLEEVVVHIVLPESRTAPPGTVASVTQRAGEIVPAVTAIQVGTRVDFPNQDEVFHNLFSLSPARPFNLGRYPPGETRSETFDESGVVRMFCDIHSEMSGVIRVLETPHFAVVDAEGRFRIEGVPEGRQTIVAWHDRAGVDSVSVEVVSSGSAAVELRPGRQDGR